MTSTPINTEYQEVQRADRFEAHHSIQTVGVVLTAQGN